MLHPLHLVLKVKILSIVKVSTMKSTASPHAVVVKRKCKFPYSSTACTFSEKISITKIVLGVF